MSIKFYIFSCKECEISVKVLDEDFIITLEISHKNQCTPTVLHNYDHARILSLLSVIAHIVVLPDDCF